MQLLAGEVRPKRRQGHEGWEAARSASAALRLTAGQTGLLQACLGANGSGPGSALAGGAPGGASVPTFLSGFTCCRTRTPPACSKSTGWWLCVGDQRGVEPGGVDSNLAWQCPPVVSVGWRTAGNSCPAERRKAILGMGDAPWHPGRSQACMQPQDRGKGEWDRPPHPGPAVVGRRSVQKHGWRGSEDSRLAHRLVNLPRDAQLALHIQLQPVLVLNACGGATVQRCRLLLLLLHRRGSSAALAAGSGPQAAAGGGAAASGGCRQHVCS